MTASTACLDAFLEAEHKMDKICGGAKLDCQFLGDQYPMECIVQDAIDANQMQLDDMQEPVKLRIIYKFDGSSVSMSCTDAEITNSLNSKLAGAFKSMCNAYAHYRYCEYLEGLADAVSK